MDNMENQQTTENILDKLEKEEDEKKWTLEEKKKLLEIYYKISKNEETIFQIIYRHHVCDSWEDVFRDYDARYLQDKAVGVKIALDMINQRIIESKL